MPQSQNDIEFVCNVCGARNFRPLDLIDREIASCSCGSTVRMRSIVHLLSIALFQRSMPLRQFPEEPTIRGIGLSDWEGYAGQVAKKIQLHEYLLSHAAAFGHLPPASVDEPKLRLPDLDGFLSTSRRRANWHSAARPLSSNTEGI